jgi:sarcosine oxidase gamma subunit
MSLPAFEWVSFDGADAGTDLALGIAPARWLVVGPQQAWLDERGEAENAGRGALIDVSGRWVAVDLARTPDAVNAAAPSDVVLWERDVASTWIFDCPVLIVRCQDEVRLLVEASYAHSLRAMLARL